MVGPIINKQFLISLNSNDSLTISQVKANTIDDVPLTSRRHQNITFLPGAVRTHRVLHKFRCDCRADFNGGQCRCKQRAHGL